MFSMQHCTIETVEGGYIIKDNQLPLFYLSKNGAGFLLTKAPYYYSIYESALDVAHDYDELEQDKILFVMKRIDKSKRKV